MAGNPGSTTHDADAAKSRTSLPHTFFDTRGASSADGFEIWRAAILPLFESRWDADAANAVFRASVESYDLEQTLMGRSTFSRLDFHRDSNHRAAEDVDHLLVQLYLRGGYVGHNGYRHLRVGPGDISLLDLGRALATRAQDSTALSLIVPRDLMFSFAKSETLRHGAVLSANSVMGRILGAHLQAVWRILPTASPTETEAINQTLLATIASAFTNDPRTKREHALELESPTREAICDYIASNLRSQALTPEQICRYFGCSRSQLYRLFQPLGGVATYIRRARLDRCLQELSTGDGGKIVDVALRWGFVSQSHFSRLFRQAYGMTARDAIECARARNRRHRAPTPHFPAHPMPEFHHWLRRV